MVFNAFIKWCSLGIAVSACPQIAKPLVKNATVGNYDQKKPTLFGQIIEYAYNIAQRISNAFMQESFYHLVKIMILFVICVMCIIFQSAISKILNRIKRLFSITGSLGIFLFSIILMIITYIIMAKIIQIFGIVNTIALISLVAIFWKFSNYIKNRFFAEEIKQIT